ncbi:MAG: sn-glycerol-3-phosphate ABC transporter ATP-binding protein UgpC [Bacilli bacterium]|nr:sn-glycerol-3-phosphate ABC transporter ATP-binding protein UgpC [Bacilli bacterium]
MADVTLRHIYKVYDGGVRAVNDFDLDIKDQEFVVFVGPSGCGKSTTLRMIAGLEEITAGQLYIDGELMNEVEPKNRDIAMVFQSYALYPHMTVYANMAFGLKLRHTPKDEIDRRVKEAAEILEISDLLSRKPKALSGGQRQRVALGRTIVRQPKVFLLDEPLSNLDAKLRVSMRSEITKLHEKLGTTFIYVTHDQTEAMTMGNRIVVMKNGFIQQADTPITLFEDPCNLFVATFLGSPQMNIVEAELFMDGKTLKAKLNDRDDMVVSFPDIKAKQLASKEYIGKKVLLGIRPEHIRPNEGNLKAFIDVVEHLGDESILYCKMENRKEQFIIKIPFNSKIRANADINVEFNMDHVYLFDADTHKAIMGIPHEDEIPVNIDKNVMTMGEQEFTLDEQFTKHLLDASFNANVKLAIKPDYISIEEVPDSLAVKAKLEFVEQKTDYQAVYFSLKGLDGYFAIKMANDQEVKLGKEVTLYLPYRRLNVYDVEHNKTNSREDIFENRGEAIVNNVNGQMHVKVGGATLVYPENPDYPNGKYDIVFKQDKLVPIFNRKMLKNSDRENPEMDNPKNKIKVYAYDEDVLGDKIAAYVQVEGFDYYATFVMKNNFSVYKMPKFELYVPQDGFVLIPKE